MNILTKINTKKWKLLVLGIIVAVCAIATRIVSIEYWNSLEWDVTGYSPYLAPLGLLWMFAYIGVLIIRKIHAPSLWIMGASGIIYFVIMFWMVNL
jgi:hypothetical protein